MEGIYIAPTAVIDGDVTLGNNCSVWHGAVLRGDLGVIRIGDDTNIQDNAVIHEQVTVGSGCTIGHSAIIHGCTISDNCVVGMGAIILNGAFLGEHCLVGAGAVVTGKMNAPAGSLILGNPAKVVRALTQEQIEYIHQDAQTYKKLAQAKLEE